MRKRPAENYMKTVPFPNAAPIVAKSLLESSSHPIVTQHTARASLYLLVALLLNWSSDSERANSAAEAIAQRSVELEIFRAVRTSAPTRPPGNLLEE